MKKLENPEHEVVLERMRQGVNELVQKYLVNHLDSSGLELEKIKRLQRAYEYAGGDSYSLLSLSTPLKRKIKINSYQYEELYVKEINQVDDYLIAYNCQTKELKIIDKPIRY